MMSAGFAFDARCEREQSLFDPPPPGADLFLSKKPLDVLRLERILRRDESLFALYVFRDPRSVVASRHAGRPDRPLGDFHTWKECERAASRLEGHPRFLRVRFERLVAEPDVVQGEIAARLPFLRRKGDFSRFHESAAPTRTGELALGGVRPPEPARARSWESDLARVKAEVLRHRDLPEVLVAYGYEPDESWLARLEGVEPAEAARARTPAWLRRIERALRYRWKIRRHLRRLGGRASG
jgi:hypothetical protein